MSRTRDAIVDAVLRGEEQHGRVVSRCSKPLQHLQPVDSGHHHVEDDDVGIELAGDPQRGVAVFDGARLPPLGAQRHAHQVAQARLVVDDEGANRGAIGVPQSGCCKCHEDSQAQKSMDQLCPWRGARWRAGTPALRDRCRRCAVEFRRDRGLP